MYRNMKLTHLSYSPNVIGAVDATIVKILGTFSLGNDWGLIQDFTGDFSIHENW